MQWTTRERPKIDRIADNVFYRPGARIFLCTDQRATEYSLSHVVDRAMRHRIHWRATTQAFERFGQLAVDCPMVDALDLLEHGLAGAKIPFQA